MKIAPNAVVRFHYTLRKPGGESVESTRDDGEPTTYLHGADGLLDGLEQALEGREAGDSFSITLPAEQAFGQRQADATRRVSAKYLKHEGKLTPGKVVRLNTEDGPITAVVLKVGKFSVDLDLNHPLAGQEVQFDVEIVEVRAATQEELDHGHAHGPGGHHH